MKIDRMNKRVTHQDTLAQPVPHSCAKEALDEDTSS